MVRYRSRQAETEDVNPRRLQRGAVKRQHINRWAVGHDEIAPGVIGPTHLGPQIIGEGNLTPGLLQTLSRGETITVEATFEVPVDGAVIEWDTIVAQRGFPDVTVPTTTLEVSKDSAYYDLAEVELSWDDWRRWATVEARVNGTAIRSWTDERGAATVPFTVPLSMRAREDLVSVFVDHGDASPHTVTARATLQLIDGAGDAAPTPDVVLFGYESTGWTYLVGATGHSSGFEAPAFDDSAWTAGAAAFGGGDTPYTDGVVVPARTTNTPLTDAQDLCARKEFTAPRTGDVILELGAAIDDLGAVWLNGFELLASTNAAGLDGIAVQDALVTLAPGTLVAGTNVVAIRHKNTVTASGCYFDIRLTLKGTA